MIKLKKDELHISHVSSTNQIANAFIKFLSHQQFLLLGPKSIFDENTILQEHNKKDIIEENKL